MEFAPSLFSTRVSSGRRTIFFDVKNTKDQKPYLKITESSISKDGEKKKTYMAVFENEMNDFKQAVEQVMGFVNQSAK
ncbi:MAG: hypothetical protein A2660_01325 [Candidatus Doudnabacteria bacterium RIFCSPHIGHO2_01_FULL_45_18]|uniref:DUF3276 family protein n=1 Tax=Candidatus Doudnabacteria bacterium RIFCSPHIGHO2_01_FULL_45_18 TaxID=1817823 RepID=A0A1F5NS87_9BACT|nr:MAG: hypothetical protein A2660_01325 [Candidatus Doudnabacteria bacterium RIFCSPHIGHO2_01_FULL_45_18]